MNIYTLFPNENPHFVTLPDCRDLMISVCVLFVCEAEEMGGPRLKRAGQIDNDEADTLGRRDMVRLGSTGGAGTSKRFMQPPLPFSPHQNGSYATRRLPKNRSGSQTPLSVAVQSSRGSLYSRGMVGLENETSPFEVWSFQGKYQVNKKMQHARQHSNGCWRTSFERPLQFT